MSDDKKSTDPISVDVTLGKEIDRASGNVLEALFLPLAQSGGRLLGDALGIPADWMRAKRLEQLDKVVRKTYSKLQADGISLEKFATIEPNELYLLTNGASLSSEGGLEDLWSGLFAEALNPESETRADQPFIRALENFTSNDAVAFDLLAARAKWQEIGNIHYSKSNSGLFDGDKTPRNELDQLERLTENCRLEYQDKIEKFEFGKLEQSWSDNLHRLGLIEYSDLTNLNHVVSQEDINIDNIEDILGEVRDAISGLRGRGIASGHPFDEIFYYDEADGSLKTNIHLSRFGRRLARACGLWANVDHVVSEYEKSKPQIVQQLLF